MRVALDELPRGTAEIIVVGGRSYAFGLRWTSAASRATLEAEAKAAALAESANFVAIHRTLNQFGIATIAHAPTGVRGWFYRPRSGAAAIAQAAGTATLAAFPLEDDRWLVLVIDKNGMFPDGDTILPSAQDAKARIETLLAQSPTPWRRRYLPTGWGIPDSKNVSPKDLLSRSRAVRLTPLWFLVNKRPLRAGLAAMASVLLAATVAAIHAVTAPGVVVRSVQPTKPLAATWTPATASIDRCLDEIERARRYNALPGWALTKYSCLGGQTLVINFSRIGNGPVEAIRAFLPAAQLSDDGRSAILTIALPPQPRLAATGPFASRLDYQLIGLDLAQRLNGVFALQAGAKPLPGELDTSGSALPWRLYSWTYQTHAPPAIWANAIGLMGAISVETLIHNPADENWQLAGNIYARP